MVTIRDASQVPSQDQNHFENREQRECWFSCQSDSLFLFSPGL